MALSEDQKRDMQADLGIDHTEAVFIDFELDRLYERAGSDYNTAVYLGWRQIMADTAKFFSYSTWQTRVDKDKVFDHVEKMVKFWQTESKTNANQLRIVGMTTIPPVLKDVPELMTSTQRRRREYR